jgi:ABC-type uncharacterized transport system ATPase component
MMSVKGENITGARAMTKAKISTATYIGRTKHDQRHCESKALQIEENVSIWIVSHDRLICKALSDSL